MHEISAEQSVIVAHVRARRNVVVDAVAGSGKSTVVLAMARDMPDRAFLQITYNSMLRKEFRDKVAEAGVTNVEVHTYHSLATKYFAPAYTDTKLRALLRENSAPVEPLPAFDVVVMDEVQDCTMLYFHFVVHVARYLPRRVQMAFLGDYRQKIYEFKGADSRFLTRAPELWHDCVSLKSRDFELCSLSTSYRITNQMADFVNDAMLGERRIFACRDGPRVTYVRNSSHNLEKIVVHAVRCILAAGGAPQDVFVLGRSVRGLGGVLHRIENALASCGVPCHVPMRDSGDMDERVINRKVVFSTFHACKGRQRRFVFVTGFDNSYFNMSKNRMESSECPNTLYVATTRATERLWLLESAQHATDRPLDFLQLTHHEMRAAPYVEFKGDPRTIFYERTEPVGGANGDGVATHYTTPTDLIRFLSESAIAEVAPVLDRIFVTETAAGDMIDIPSFVETRNGLFEDVSDLNGIAIPLIYFEQLSKTDTPKPSALYALIEANVAELRGAHHDFLRDAFADLDPTARGVSDYLYMSNVYVSTQERLYYRLKQIERDEYTWLDTETVEACRARIDAVLGADCVPVPGRASPEVERTLLRQSEDDAHVRIDEVLRAAYGAGDRFRFAARADLVTHNCLWEIKCTSEISMDHLLQVLLYAWIWRMLPGAPSTAKRAVRIFNVKTGEILRLEAETDELTEVVVVLLRAKYAQLPPVADEDFLATALKSVV